MLDGKEFFFCLDIVALPHTSNISTGCHENTESSSKLFVVVQDDQHRLTLDGAVIKAHMRRSDPANMILKSVNYK